ASGHALGGFATSHPWSNPSRRTLRPPDARCARPLAGHDNERPPRCKHGRLEHAPSRSRWGVEAGAGPAGEVHDPSARLEEGRQAAPGGLRRRERPGHHHVEALVNEILDAPWKDPDVPQIETLDGEFE